MIDNKEFIDTMNKLQQEYDKIQSDFCMVCKQYNSLLKHHNEWLSETKKGMDAYEYCLQELEKENAELREKLLKGKNDKSRKTKSRTKI